MNFVISCEHQEHGSRRIYSFRDKSTVIESVSLPVKLRFRYYDGRNHAVVNKRLCSEMKRAVELFKKQRGITK